MRNRRGASKGRCNIRISISLAALTAVAALNAPVPLHADEASSEIRREVLTAHWRGEELQYAQNDLTGAIAAYDRALQLDPDHLVSLLGRAEALRKLQRHQAALSDLDRAIALGADWTGYLMRARSREAMGNTTGAIADYRSVLVEYPGHTAARQRLAELDGLP